MAKKSPSTDPGIILVTSYFLLLAVNALVLLLANLLAPTSIVLGTAHLTLTWALLLSASELALINTLIIPFINQYERGRKSPFSPMDWMLMYFFINAAGLYIITRFAEVFGLGVSSWLIIVALAIVMDIGQGIAMMQLEKYRK